MRIEDIIVILQNRLIALGESRKVAVVSGDLARVVDIDNDITNTTLSLEQLQSSLGN